MSHKKIYYLKCAVVIDAKRISGDGSSIRILYYGCEMWFLTQMNKAKGNVFLYV